MSMMSVDVLMAGISSTAIGLILQAIGRIAFSRCKGDDTKELAGVVGFRVSAIFGIAVGLIFGSTTAHFVETKKNLLEETRLMGTLYVLAANSPDIENSRAVQNNIREYMERSVIDLDDPETATETAQATNQLLLKICRQMAPDSGEAPETLWVKSEFQRSCARLIDARGKKRIGAMEKHVSGPFWIFFAISFSALAILVGVFEPRLINIVFSSHFYFAAGVTAMLIYAASDPYREPGRISAKPIAQLLNRIDSLDASR